MFLAKFRARVVLTVIGCPPADQGLESGRVGLKYLDPVESGQILTMTSELFIGNVAPYYRLGDMSY